MVVVMMVTTIIDSHAP